MSPETRDNLKMLTQNCPIGQSAFDGLEPPTTGEQLVSVSRMPMRGPQAPLDIGLWDPMRKQMDLF